jgi:hypothetical protein
VRVSFWSRRAISACRGASRDGRASHVATNGHATTGCLDIERYRLGGLRTWGFQRGKEIDNGNPKSGRQNDEPASEPPKNLLIVFVTQEPPERVHESADVSSRTTHWVALTMPPTKFPMVQWCRCAPRLSSQLCRYGLAFNIVSGGSTVSFVVVLHGARCDSDVGFAFCA